MAASSLLELCLCYLAGHVDCYHGDIKTLPPHLKDRLFKLMSSQGAITDTNIGQVLHPGLQVADLQNCKVSDGALRQLCSCRQLRKIILNSRKEDCFTVTSEGVAAVAASCPYLCEVELWRCRAVTDEGVLAVARNCKLLQVITLSGCVAITDAALLALGRNCRLLHSISFAATQVRAWTVTPLCCPGRLRQGRRSHTDQVTDDGVVGLVNGVCSQTLKELTYK
ncbi:protein AMN1 homolog isoform X3 [Lepisosteus oculatus]|uniref:protein AMN1 homolog isoform X3 n=1 Tax=Lepisosteus oculatus TaxID=7918 RepID=UPI003723A7EB